MSDPDRIAHLLEQLTLSAELFFKIGSDSLAKIADELDGIHGILARTADDDGMTAGEMAAQAAQAAERIKREQAAKPMPPLDGEIARFAAEAMNALERPPILMRQVKELPARSWWERVGLTSDGRAVFYNPPDGTFCIRDRDS